LKLTVDIMKPQNNNTKTNYVQNFYKKRAFRVIRFKNEGVVFDTKDTIKRIKEILTNTVSNYG